MEIREIQDFEDGAFVVPANNEEMIFVFRKCDYTKVNFYIALRGDGTLYYPTRHNKDLKTARAATALEVRFFHTALAMAGMRWNPSLKVIQSICEM